MTKSEKQKQKHKWFADAVIYQIYPRSFKDTTDNGIGDLSGIIEKLDYLNDDTEQSLGVDAIWLSPIYPSPMNDFGYDVSNHKDVDPLFGDLNTFDLLVKEAHKRGIKIILDFIPNHTSSEHSAFKESRSSRDNPKRDWYVWHDPAANGGPPNNWLGRFGGSAWEYDEKTDQYYLHQYLSSQPDLNWRNSEVQKALTDVMRFWFGRGVDGLRVDVINRLIEDLDMKDEPRNPNYQPGRDDPYNALLHIYTRTQPETLKMVKLFCEVLDDYEDRYLIGEARLNVKEMIEFYDSCHNNRMSPFNFNLMGLPWNAKSYRSMIDLLEQSLEDTHGHLLAYVLGNHDQPRLASRIGIDRARVASMLLLTLRGTPFIYYGDEIGMTNVEMPFEKTHDPWEKKMLGMGLGRDPQRTPMQWCTEQFAGFSKKEPWLPVSPDYIKYNVDSQQKDPQSILNLHKKLIHMRKSSKILREGEYYPIDTNNKNVFAYERIHESGKMLVVLNFGEQDVVVIAGEGKAHVLCNTFLDKIGESIDLTSVFLRSNEGYVLSPDH